MSAHQEGSAQSQLIVCQLFALRLLGLPWYRSVEVYSTTSPLNNWWGKQRPVMPRCPFCHAVGIVLASRLFGGINHSAALSIICASDGYSQVRDESSGSTTFFPR